MLWPSTLDAEPMHADHRTNHAAQPVTQARVRARLRLRVRVRVRVWVRARVPLP